MKTIYLIPALALGLMLSSACEEKNGAETNASQVGTVFAVHEVAGLKLELPAPPVIGDIQLTDDLKPLVSAFEAYKISDGSTQISIIYTTYKTAEIDLDGSVNGSITQIKSFPDVSDFVSNTNPVQVSGNPSRVLELNYHKSGHEINHHIIVFVRGLELWQIQVINHHQDSAATTKALSDRVFGSIELLD